MSAYRADLEAEAEKGKRWRRGLLLSGLGAILLAGVLGLFAFHRWAYHDLPPLPEPEALWSLKRETSIRLMDRDGNEIARRGPIYGQAVDVGELPNHLVSAFLAIEDRKFYEHDGVDHAALVRATLANWRAGAYVQGGSTLTQQLVKNLVLSPERTVKRKLQEMRLAQALEQRMAKQDILALYLNRVYLGGRAFGVDGAAQRYFGKSARDVTLAEAAILAALPKAPSRLDPSNSLERTRARAALVLDAMVEAGYLTPAQAEIAKATAPDILPEAINEEPFEIGYVFDLAVQTAQALVPGEVNDLIIYTTIDMELQAAGDAAVDQIMDRRGATLNAQQAALVALAEDGGMAALIGGRSYAESQFNRVHHARRQPGSAFKPFVFAAALEEGVDVNDIYNDTALTVDGWSPTNYYEGFRGRMTLRTAFENSVNTIAARLTDEVGPQKVSDLALRFGIGRQVDALPSIALGSEWVTLEGLTAAYAVFRDGGRRLRPHLVTRVEDTRGRVLYARPDVPVMTVYDPELSREMAGLLRGVTERGTGVTAAPSGIPVAGKTGTSQGWRDALFVGYSPRYVVGVWVGNDDNSPMKEVTGAGLPADIWKDFMARAHAGKPGGDIPGEVPFTSTLSRERFDFYDALARELAARVN